MFLQNIKIGTRLALGFSIVIVIIILSAWFTMTRLNGMYEQTLLVEKQNKQAVLVDDLALQTTRLMNHLLYTATTHKQEGFQLADEAASVFEQNLNILLESDSTANKENLKRLSAAFDRYYALGKEMAFVYLTEGQEEGALLISGFDEAAKALTSSMKLLREEQVAQARAGIHSIVVAHERIKKVLLFTNGAIVLLSFFLSFVITSSIVRPVGQVVRGLSEIAAGRADLSQRLIVTGKDEVSILAGKFNSFTEKLEQIIKEFKDNAMLLKSTSQDLAGLSGNMASGAGGLAEQITQAAAATEEMSMNIMTLAKSADSMSGDAGTVSVTAEQISQNMQTVAAAMEEMDAGMHSIAENARTGSTIAGEAKEKSMAVSDAMGLMNEASLEIGEVSAVIKKIADKTHLLALNATIEAASAGDAGLGFAVIAGEIKELAKQSAEAAENIGNRIKGVKQGNAKAVNVVSDIASTTEKIIEAVEVINTSTEQQTLSTGEIAASVHQVSVGIEDIAASIVNVSTGSVETSRVLAETTVSVQDLAADISGVNSAADLARGNAETVKNSAGELATISRKLEGIVEKFVISEEMNRTSQQKTVRSTEEIKG
jgi:methyl-accepting chemotaxis protein